MGEQVRRKINGEYMTLEECYEKHSRLIQYGVHRALRGMKPTECEMSDLYSVGTVGFIKAYQRYKPDKGAKFSTYAVPMIWGEITRYMGREYSLLRKTRRVNDLRRKMGNDLGEMTAKELADKYKVTIREVEEVRLEVMEYRSMDIPVGIEVEGDALTLHAYYGELEDFTGVYVKEFINILGERQKKIVKMLLQGMLQVEMAEELGVTQPVISRELVRIRNKYEIWNKNTG